MYVSRFKSQIFKILRNLLVKFLGNKNPTKKIKRVSLSQQRQLLASLIDKVFYSVSIVWLISFPLFRLESSLLVYIPPHQDSEQASVVREESRDVSGLRLMSGQDGPDKDPADRTVLLEKLLSGYKKVYKVRDNIKC